MPYSARLMLITQDIEDVYEDWNDEIDDPLPDCQHDALIPLRVKWRNIEKPAYGTLETLKDGQWVAYKQNGSSFI